jgi:acetolactate synthase I/II/III large subunit
VQPGDRVHRRHGPETRYRQVYQEIRDLDMFEPVTKWNTEVENPERLPDIVAQAFRVATTGAPGPVHVELRGNTGQLAVGASDTDRPFALTVDRRFGEVPPFRPVADPDLIAGRCPRSPPPSGRSLWPTAG